MHILLNIASVVVVYVLINVAYIIIIVEAMCIYYGGNVGNNIFSGGVRDIAHPTHLNFNQDDGLVWTSLLLLGFVPFICIVLS